MDKADWNKYRIFKDEHIAVVQEEENIPHTYKKMMRLIREAATVFFKAHDVFINFDDVISKKKRNFGKVRGSKMNTHL